MCVYVCMYICMYVGGCVCMCVCMYVCMYVCMWVGVYVCLYVCLLDGSWTSRGNSLINVRSPSVCADLNFPWVTPSLPHYR